MKKSPTRFFMLLLLTAISIVYCPLSLDAQPSSQGDPQTGGTLGERITGFASAMLNPHNYYEKVIDQYGQPVPDVEVTGTLIISAQLLPDFGDGFGEHPYSTKQFATKTDKNGFFECTSGYPLLQGFGLKKEGYQFGIDFSHDPTVPLSYKEHLYIPPNKEDKTSPSERGVFKLWKTQGAERLYVLSTNVKISADGSTANIDFLNGKKVVENGDFAVTFTRMPLSIQRDTVYTWSLKIEALHGGLLEINDPYPYSAPTHGYQKAISLSMTSPEASKIYARKEAETVRRAYYYQADGGKYYGRIYLTFNVATQPPPISLRIDGLINATGSRNLEFDRAAQSDGPVRGAFMWRNGPPPPVPQ